MAQMPTTGAPPQTEFRDLKELLSSYQQEVQKSEAQLKRTYDMLDNQAAQTAQECMDRYLLNNALLARIVHGPEATHHIPGGTTELSGFNERLKACSGDEVTPEVESSGRGSSEGRGKQCSEHDPVDGSARVANSSVSEAECHTISVKGEIEITGAVSGTGDRATRKRKQTLIAPGVHRVELCELDEDLIPMGPAEDAIIL
ncbi:hypothetical protein COCOBI_13-0030 [Coccomyxa sp. Obi]|nr:hypothetical protein COCOBI_13-0030 [Coccomyxa sp. Obi]